MKTCDCYDIKITLQQIFLLEKRNKYFDFFKCFHLVMEVGASGWHGPYAPRDAMEERESGIVSATIRFHFTEVLTVKETENKKRAATPNLVQVRTGVAFFSCALHILVFCFYV